MAPEYCVVVIGEDGEYTTECTHTTWYAQAIDMAKEAKKQGVEVDILKLTTLRDAYGVDMDEMVWIPQEVGV